jgi:hypothetical protein
LPEAIMFSMLSAAYRAQPDRVVSMDEEAENRWPENS